MNSKLLLIVLIAVYSDPTVTESRHVLDTNILTLSYNAVG